MFKNIVSIPYGYNPKRTVKRTGVGVAFRKRNLKRIIYKQLANKKTLKIPLKYFGFSDKIVSKQKEQTKGDYYVNKKTI